MASFKVSSVLRALAWKHKRHRSGSSRPRAIRFVQLSCTALLLCAGLAVAQAPEEETARVVSLLRSGEVDHALLALRGSLAGFLAESPDQALMVCTAAAQSVKRHTEHSPGKWPELANLLVQIGGNAANTCEGEGSALAAHAQAHLCRARIHTPSSRSNADPRDWGQAITLYCEAELADPRDGAALKRALGVVREATDRGTALPAGVLEKAALIVRKVALDYPGESYHQEAAHRLQLHYICCSLRESRTQGRKVLRAYLARIQAGMARTLESPLSVTAYNDIVTLAKRRKVPGIRAKYKTETFYYGKRVLALTYPAGTRWKWTGCGRRALTQYDLEGRPIRTISLSSYSWG